MENQVNMIFRIPEELKVAFENVCHQQDRTPSQIMRDMIRAYVRDHQQLELDLNQKTKRRKK